MCCVECPLNVVSSAWCSAIFDTSAPFEALLKRVYPEGLKKKQLTRSEMKFIRSKSARPRRFSLKFIADERRQAEETRGKIRALQSGQKLDPREAQTLPATLPGLLCVGQTCQGKQVCF